MILKSKIGIILTLVAAMFVVTGCATYGGNDSVDNAEVGDLLTERKIYQAIQADSGLNGQAIFVSCIDGVVTLSGTVESGIERTLAAKVAKSVSGVSSVVNNITASS